MSEAAEADVGRLVETPETKEAEASILERLRHWQQMPGPPCAYFEYRRRQGPDMRCEYFAWSVCGVRLPYWGDPMRPDTLVEPTRVGLKSLPALVGWFPDALEGMGVQLGFEPASGVLVWRHMVEVRLDRMTGRFVLFARAGFMPKDAWPLEVSE